MAPCTAQRPALTRHDRIDYARGVSSTPSILSHVTAANSITSTGALLGLAAVALTLNGLHSAALTCLIGAVLCDRLDGIVARRLGQSSDFGMQLDSLADAVSFLVAPAAVVVILSSANPVVAVACAAFVLAGLWRLAHFNVHGMDTGGTESVFRGLPTTIAGSGFLLVWAGLRLSPIAPHADWLLAGFLLAMAPLMLSTMPIRKNGWLIKALQILALPTLIAAWWV